MAAHKETAHKISVLLSFWELEFVCGETLEKNRSPVESAVFVYMPAFVQVRVSACRGRVAIHFRLGNPPHSHLLSCDGMNMQVYFCGYSYDGCTRRTLLRPNVGRVSPSV